MVSTTKNDRTEKLGITFPKSLLRTIDARCGDVPAARISEGLEIHLTRCQLKIKNNNK
jgi:hypothetical protein